MPYTKPKFGGGLAVSVDVWHEMTRQMILWMTQRYHITLNERYYITLKGRLDKGGIRHFTDSPQTRNLPNVLCAK